MLYYVRNTVTYNRNDANGVNFLLKFFIKPMILMNESRAVVIFFVQITLMMSFALNFLQIVFFCICRVDFSRLNFENNYFVIDSSVYFEICPLT